MEARKAGELGEIPIGAVVVRDGCIVGRGHNLTETAKDPTAHAEMLAIRQAAKTLGGWRLLDCEMYVTAEPCAMCAGAIIWARIGKLHIGTPDPKAGACGSVFNIVQEKRLNHYVEVEYGEMADECRDILKAFFKDLRKRAREGAQTKEKEAEDIIE